MNSKAAQLREIENEETKAMSTNAGQQQVAIVTGASSGLGWASRERCSNAASVSSPIRARLANQRN